MTSTIEDIQYEQFMEKQATEAQIEKRVNAKLKNIVKKAEPTDIDEARIEDYPLLDDHFDRVADRDLKQAWGQQILKLLAIYGGLNYALILCYGLGILTFSDTNVLKIFLGGNVAAIPTIAIFITKSLFTKENRG